MAQPVWDRGTRWLHGGLALTVSFQLFVSLVMEVPQPGLRPQPLGRLGFQGHEGAGVAVIVLVALHWIWSLSHDRGRPIRHLFPWGRLGRGEIAADLGNLRAGRLPPGGPAGGLAGFVHGLGFLAVTGMAVLGGLMLLVMGKGAQSALFHRLADAHSLLANFVWLYWLGHVAMVVVHEARGHRILAGIFKL